MRFLYKLKAFYIYHSLKGIFSHRGHIFHYFVVICLFSNTMGEYHELQKPQAYKPLMVRNLLMTMKIVIIVLPPFKYRMCIHGLPKRWAHKLSMKSK